jgi:exodeoxyribonuclease V alpha subunit
MKPVVDLSPLGTARLKAEDPLLAWLGPVRERLASLFGIEPEVSYLAWEVARWPADLELEERQALVLLILTALIALRQGSTRLPLRGDSGRLDIACRLLDGARESMPLEPARLLGCADRLIDSGRAGLVVGQAGEFKPLIVSGAYLYLQKMHELEVRFAASLRRRLSRAGSDWTEDEMSRVMSAIHDRPGVRAGTPIVLSPDQTAAVRAALRFRLAVISGGPGTGKTTIVVSILRALCRLGFTATEIVLAAPTGKAAKRLGEAVRSGLSAIERPSPEDVALGNLSDPLTLHSLLGYSRATGRFLYHEHNRLEARVVVVDEASMVDLVLMERLVRSVRDEARLLLLGDDHQLPSVEAGAVLRDLIGGNSPLESCAVRLTESHRLSTDILEVSHAIDQGMRPVFVAGSTGEAAIVERAAVSELEFKGIEFLESAAGAGVIASFLDQWYARMILGGPEIDAALGRDYKQGPDGFDADDVEALSALFEHFDRARILCLTRVRATGAERINAYLHRRALEVRDRGSGAGLMPGEPVMMQVNDYGRMIFNGDQGLILRVSDHGRSVEPMVVFRRDDAFIAFRIDSLRANLVHSFAITVHKAQGSEYDHVALVLPDVDIPLNTREILYTALTRARKSVTIAGTHQVFDRGVARGIHRSSGLAEMLQSGLGLVRAAPGSTG